MCGSGDVNGVREVRVWWKCRFFFLMIRRPPRSTQSRSSAASDVYKRQNTSITSFTHAGIKQHHKAHTMITPSNVLLNWINELIARRDALILSTEKISDNERRMELMDEAYDICGKIARAKYMLADINREITNSMGYR